MDKEHYIAYIIIPEEIPKKGIDMLFFYTKKGEKYYWGTDNNSFSQEFVDDLESRNKIVKLPELIKLADEKSLWIDKFGKVYFEREADIQNYNLGLKNLKCLEGITLNKN